MKIVAFIHWGTGNYYSYGFGGLAEMTRMYPSGYCQGDQLFEESASNHRGPCTGEQKLLLGQTHFKITNRLSSEMKSLLLYRSTYP